MTFYITNYIVNDQISFQAIPITKTRMHSSRMRTVHSSSRLLGGGLSAAGGCLLLGGGGGIPACTEADPPPRGQTDRCKNITFATSLRTVTKLTEQLRNLSVN